MNLKYWRELRKMSIIELSRRSNIPVRAIEDIEEQGRCSIDTAKKLARALNINPYDLVSDYNYKGQLYDVDLKEILNYLLATIPYDDFKVLLSDINTYEHGIHIKAMDKAYQLCEDIKTNGIDKVNIHWQKTLPQW